ncbi:MAG: DUF2339 domain-containing protein, partial [Paracoccaceae bacterium]
PEVIAAYLGPIVGFCAALSVLAGLDRPKARGFLGSAAWTTAGVFVSILLFRWLSSLSGGHTLSHWAMGLFASIWLILMLAQIHRMSLGGALQYLRIGLAGAYALFSGALLAASVLLLNPLWGGLIPSVSIEVIGPPVLNSLAIAYLLPAGILIQIPRYRAHLHRHLWITACALAVVLGAVWIFAALRHVWQGSEGMDLSHPMTQPELYSYTVVLLLVGAGLFYQSLARRAKRMRQVGLAVIGLAVIKVFFVDISELNGLTRVFSFLLLGLALAGLAWLERWANRGSSAPPPDTDT